MEWFDLSVKKPGGETIRMSDLRGKVILVVNTATRCGLAPQFRDLEQLHQKYKEQGLLVLGFPSNQFRQEPESNETVEQSCALNFGVSFQLTEQVRVNGKDTHPVFRFLKDQLSGKLGKRINWNFTKFLVTREGKPYKRYAPATKPAELEEDIRALLAQQ
jgi:glutathione peroxidase